MENINIFIKKKKPIVGQGAFHSESPYDKRSGFFGVVAGVHYKNNTVDVCSDSGRVFTNIRVASPQWVTLPTDDSTSKNKDTLTGRRYLPPKETYVYCLMPTGEPSSAIVLCSVFAYQDSGHAALRDGGEDFQYIDEHIDNGGWRFTHDIRTGTRKIQNSPKDGDASISLEINQEEGKEKVILKIHKNNFIIEKDGNVTVRIEGTAKIDVKGNVELAAEGDVKAVAENISFQNNGAAAARKGDKVKVSIPANSFLVSVTGQATGTPNMAAVEIEGTIQEGSDTVKVG